VAPTIKSQGVPYALVPIAAVLIPTVWTIPVEKTGRTGKEGSWQSDAIDHSDALMRKNFIF
jgi:hypothetical protein